MKVVDNIKKKKFLRLNIGYWFLYINCVVENSFRGLFLGKDLFGEVRILGV